MRIIIPTCDRYLKLIQANKYTTDKFGGKDLDVTVLGFKEPEFDMGSWKFISLGTDTGPQSYTNDIYKFFKDFKDEYFIYGNDDIIVMDNMNLDLIDEFKKLMDENEDIVKIGFTPYPKTHFRGEPFGDNFVQAKQSADYRLSLTYGIWRTSYFMKYFELGLSPWQWELRQDIARNDGKIILGTTNKHVMDIGHLYRQGAQLRPTWYISETTGIELSKEDIEHLKPMVE